MNERPFLVELVLAVLAGAAVWTGVRVGQRLEDRYSEPRLTIDSLIAYVRGGDNA